MAKKGYHLWYNVEENRLYLSKIDVILEEQQLKKEFKLKEMNHSKSLDLYTNVDFSSSPEGFLYSENSPYLFIDKSGSKLAEAVNSFYSVETFKDFTNLQGIINSLNVNQSIVDNLNSVIEKNLFITNEGNFVKNSVENVKQIIFSKNLSVITNNYLNIYGDEIENTGLSNLSTKSISIPNSVNVLSQSLLFNDDEITLSINMTRQEFANLVEGNFANGNNVFIKFTDTDEPIRLHEFLVEIVDNYIPEYKPIKFDIGVKNYNNTTPTSLRLALDQLPEDNKIELVAHSFSSANGNIVSSRKVRWNTSDSTIAEFTDESSSVLTIKKEGHITITATAEVGGHQETFDLYLSKIIGFTVKQGSTVIDNNLNYQFHDAGEEIYLTIDNITKWYFDVNHNEIVNWSSSDTNVATIDNDGKITVYKAGSVTISVHFEKYPDQARSFTLNISQIYDDYFVFKFPNTDKYIYKIGNKNQIDIISTFIENVVQYDDFEYEIVNAYDNEVITSVTPISIQKSGNLVQFSGTGVIKITYRAFADPFNQGLKLVDEKTLVLEVIDAYNVTTFSQLKSNQTSSRVLLNDIVTNEYGISASGGATIFGNGFTLDATNVPIVDTNKFVIILNGGNLDNIVLIGRKVPYHNFTSTSNPDGAPSGSYAIYGVFMSGNNHSTISNSYVSGFKSPVRINSVKATLDNVVIDGGTLANVYVDGQTELILKDVTTIQSIVQAPKYNNPNQHVNVYGLGIFFENVGDSTKVYIRGELKQYNWTSNEEINYIDSDLRSIANSIYNDNSLNIFKHLINNKNYINTGLIFNGNAELGSNIFDERSSSVKEKSTYARTTISIIYNNVPSGNATLYSYVNTSGISHNDVLNTGLFTFEGYSPSKNQITTPYFTYEGETSFTLELDDTTNTYSTALFDLTSIIVSKYSGEVTYPLYDIRLNNQPLSDDTKIILTSADTGINKLTFKICDNNIYNVNGEKEAFSVEYEFEIEILVKKDRVQKAQIILDSSKIVTYFVRYPDGFLGALSDWHYAIQILQGVQVYDYDETTNSMVLVYDGTNKTTKPSELEITVASSSSYVVPGSFKQYGGKLYFVSNNKTDNRQYTFTATITYKYYGVSGDPATASITVAWNSSTKDQGKISDYK